MGRLIDEDDVIDALRKCNRHCIDLFDSYHIDIEDAEARIRRLPSVQPERKRGRWIPVDSYSAFGGDEATWMAHGNPVAFYYCSECKEHAYAGEDGADLLTDFCPCCGADMRGERDDEQRSN